MTTYKKMKPDVKRAWIKDLKTAEQGKCALAPTVGSHCCLGRLAIVLGYEFAYPTLGHSFNPSTNGHIVGAGSHEELFLPHVILNEAGLSLRASKKLAKLNDAPGKTFKHVIAWIREHL